MSRFSNLLRGAIGLGAIVGIAACGDVDGKLLRPVNPPGGALFRNYVAMGNSITAGFQSGGINDSVQRQSYAFLLARQAKTRFAYPSINKTVRVSASLSVTSGCPPMLGNWATQRPTDSLISASPSRPLCSLRDATKATDILNNVAVPGAFATDLLVKDQNIKTPSSAAANQFFLGGTSQLQRAIMAEPTFVSLWIGNNETLQPASVGLLGGYPPSGVPALVTTAEFSTGFNAAVDSLVKVYPELEGILIGAVKVANTPRFFSADSLGLSATKRTAFGSFTGLGPPTIVGCGTVVTGWLVSIELAKAIRSGAHPNLVSCLPSATPGAGRPDGAGDPQHPGRRVQRGDRSEGHSVRVGVPRSEPTSRGPAFRNFACHSGVPELHEQYARRRNGGVRDPLFARWGTPLGGRPEADRQRGDRCREREIQPADSDRALIPAPGLYRSNDRVAPSGSTRSFFPAPRWFSRDRGNFVITGSSDANARTSPCYTKVVHHTVIHSVLK
jgi:hypothetical protein